MRVLILVDLQNDFMPGGALAVPKGDEVIPVVNGLTPHFPLVVATQDWHPATHVSFACNHPGAVVGDVLDVNGLAQILWPVHCVQNSTGAQLISGLKKERLSRVFYKGVGEEIDSYSTFFDNAHRRSTGLLDYLREQEVTELYFAGVATDYCVLYSVRDAIQLGFVVYVLTDACRAINLHPEDEQKAYEEMRAKGAHLVKSAQFL